MFCLEREINLLRGHRRIMRKMINRDISNCRALVEGYAEGVRESPFYPTVISTGYQLCDQINLREKDYKPSLQGNL